MKTKKTFYVTTPIYYVNAAPTVGSAYTTIAADILARWHKLLGEDVFFLTGTDEHGQKVQEAAEKAKLTPKDFCDKIAIKFKRAWQALDIEYNNFIRTTDPKHEEEVKKILQELYDKGLIYKGYYETCYCVGCEQYLTLSDLSNGKCPIHEREPEIRKEEAYLFKLSSFQDKILELIESGKFSILPEARKKEVVSFIKTGLQDISISRLKEKVPWGIELPFDSNHTCFVWVDAFWNYLTGLIEENVFDKYWPPALQLMAKDILRVHSTIWPALLLATDNKLPKTLFVHGYFTIDGKKISKSLSNVISPTDLVEKYGADSVRYFLTRQIPFGEDGDFSEKSLVERHNNELANKLGNLVSRVTTLAEKYGIEKCKNKLLDKLRFEEIKELIEDYELDKALGLIFEFIDACNEYIQREKPWEASYTNKGQTLYELVNSIKAISYLLWPFMPETCEKIAQTLGYEIKSFKDITKPVEGKIKKSDILFQKI
jgi:methionyl-tRNA synthetase